MSELFLKLKDLCATILLVFCLTITCTDLSVSPKKGFQILSLCIQSNICWQFVGDMVCTKSGAADHMLSKRTCRYPIAPEGFWLSLLHTQQVNMSNTITTMCRKNSNNWYVHHYFTENTKLLDWPNLFCLVDMFISPIWHCPMSKICCKWLCQRIKMLQSSHRLVHWLHICCGTKTVKIPKVGWAIWLCIPMQ